MPLTKTAIGLLYVHTTHRRLTLFYILATLYCTTLPCTVFCILIPLWHCVGEVRSDRNDHYSLSSVYLLHATLLGRVCGRHFSVLFFRWVRGESKEQMGRMNAEEQYYLLSSPFGLPCLHPKILSFHVEFDSILSYSHIPCRHTSANFSSIYITGSLITMN